MRRFTALFTALSFVTLFGVTACAEDGTESGEATEEVDGYDADVTIEDDDDLDDEIGEGLEETGEAIGEGLEETGEALEEGAEEVTP